MSIQDQIVDALAQIATALERDHELQRSVLSVTQNANRLRGNRPVPIGTGGRVMAWGGSGRLVGWTLAAAAAARHHHLPRLPGRHRPARRRPDRGARQHLGRLRPARRRRRLR